MKDEIKVVLVDESDREIGTLEKLEAHRKGLLHRAISVFVFNNRKEWLLQQRAADKYHCPGLWTNTCCTHPLPHESYRTAAERRVREEMGFEPVLTEQFRFIYRAELDHDLIEHELDTVFTGISDTIPSPCPEEVSSFRYLSTTELDREIAEHPARFTPWFLKMYPRVKLLLTGEE